MSTQAGAGLRQRPRLAALGVSLCLLACSGAESSADDDASRGSSPGAGGVVASSGSGGSTPTGGAALGGSGTGGSASGGVAPTGGVTLGGGASTSGGTATGGGSGASGAASGAAGGFQFGGTAGSAAGGRGGAATGGSGGSAAGGRGGSLGAAGKANAGSTSGGAGAVASGGAGGSGGASSSCPYQGSISYTLMRAASPTAAQTAAYDKITAALDKALGYYNCYTDITKQLRASYEPSVATADGNVNGSIRFGSQDSMNYITAMHEIGHTVGVGSNEWGRMIRDGIFTGATATAKLREIDGDPAAQVHGDSQHFWPYGLNYTNEVKSDADLLAHCALVMAIRADLYP